MRVSPSSASLLRGTLSSLAGGAAGVRGSPASPREARWLMHRSEIPPGTALQVGNVIEVDLLSLEAKRGRLGWTTQREA